MISNTVLVACISFVAGLVTSIVTVLLQKRAERKTQRESAILNARIQKQLLLYGHRLEMSHQSIEPTIANGIGPLGHDKETNRLATNLRLSESTFGRELFSLLLRDQVSEDDYYKPRVRKFGTLLTWGPPSSGKTCLTLAFAGSLRPYCSPRVFFELSDRSGQRIDETSDIVGLGGTRSVLAQHYLFTRRFATSEPRGKISSFSHSLVLVDVPGRICDKIWDKPDRSLPRWHEKWIEYDLMRKLEAPSAVLFALDPSQRSYSSPVGDYVETFRRASTWIGSKGNLSETIFCFCLTKCDQYFDKVKNKDGEAVLQDLFSEDMLGFYRTLPCKAIFLTSALGFDHSGTLAPALAPRVSYGLGWRPYGVEFPFFMAFEYAERRNLGKIGLRTGKTEKYIPYPQPRTGILAL